MLVRQQDICGHTYRLNYPGQENLSQEAWHAKVQSHITQREHRQVKDAIILFL